MTIVGGGLVPARAAGAVVEVTAPLGRVAAGAAWWLLVAATMPTATPAVAALVRSQDHAEDPRRPVRISPLYQPALHPRWELAGSFPRTRRASAPAGAR